MIYPCKTDRHQRYLMDFGWEAGLDQANGSVPPKKDQTEHDFRKAPGNFTWDVIPEASGTCLLEQVV